MPITSLSFTNLGPFEDADFEFDEHVNVFTGPNNSGKSTVLWILGEIFVYPFAFPTKLLRPQSAAWQSTFLIDRESRSLNGSLPIGVDDTYGMIKMMLEEIGFTAFVPALRQSTDFRSEGPSSAHRIEPRWERELSELVRNNSSNRPWGTLDDAKRDFAEQAGPDMLKRHSLIESDPHIARDDEVVQKIIELDYRAYRQNRPEMRNILDKLGAISSEITEGFPIEFGGVGEDERGLFPQFRSPDGDVPLNVLSQGTQSLIQWLSHLLIGFAEYYDTPDALEEKPGILIIDEIDAHLHPSWQRKIIPTLTSHFPNLQIFCSTHSPLMLAGLKEGQVQLLRRDEKGNVTVSRNETDIIGWSADEILRNFLDVPSPTDLETVRHVDRLQELRRKDTLSGEESAELEALRHTVSQDLMGGPVAGEVERLTDLIKQARPRTGPGDDVPNSGRRGTTRRRRGTSG